MALVVLTLAEMKAHSALAEVQALTDGTLEPLEAEALDLLEAELGRRLTVDTEDVARTLDGRGISLLALPERLDSFTSVVSTSWETSPRAWRPPRSGWVLRGAHPYHYHWRGRITITGQWGLSCPYRVKRVLMDVVEALAVRKSDLVTRRDELAPWGRSRTGPCGPTGTPLPTRGHPGEPAPLRR